MNIGYYAFALFVTGLVCLIAVTCKILFGNVKRSYRLLDEKESKLLQLYQMVESIMEDFDEQAMAISKEIKEHEDRLASIVANLAPLPQDNRARYEEEPPAAPPAQKPPTAPIAQKLPNAPPAQKPVATAAAQKPPTAPIAQIPPTAPAAQKPPTAPIAQKPPAAAQEPLPRVKRVDPGRTKKANEGEPKAERAEPIGAPYDAAIPEKKEAPVFQEVFDISMMKKPAPNTGTQDKLAHTQAILGLAEEGRTDAQIASELGITQNEVRLIIGINRRRSREGAVAMR